MDNNKKISFKDHIDDENVFKENFNTEFITKKEFCEIIKEILCNKLAYDALLIELLKKKKIITDEDVINVFSDKNIDELANILQKNIKV